MDLYKLAKLAKTNPSAAKAFLNKKAPTTEPRKLDKQDRVFTEGQLKMIVASLVEAEVAKIPQPKDGKTPTRDEIQRIIAPLIPVVRQPKDGKDAELTPKFLNEVTDKVLKQLPTAPNLTQAIIDVLKSEKVKLEELKSFQDLKARVDKLADNQKWINNRPSGGYTDSDVRRVLTEEGIGGVWANGGSTKSTLTVSATEPTNPSLNDLWVDIS